MNVRFFDFGRDYATLMEWHRRWGYHPIPPEILPVNGLIVHNQGYDIGAAWIYLTDGRVALMEGAILNPDAPKDARVGAHAFLISALEELAKESGCVQMWIPSKDRFAIRTSERLGFKALPNNFKFLTKEL